MKKFKTWKSLLGLLLAMMVLLSACSAAAPADSSGDSASAETAAAADETQAPLQEEPAEQTQEQTFEAWVDEKRRLVSFHKIPGARRYCAPERAFWEQVTELVLSGYRVQ